MGRLIRRAIFASIILPPLVALTQFHKRPAVEEFTSSTLLKVQESRGWNAGEPDFYKPVKMTLKRHESENKCH